MSVDPYVYPGTTTLQNKLDIRNSDDLDRLERRLSTQRAREGLPTGDYDLKHLQAIHGHLFQDVYAWAGKTRSVELAKGGNQFLPVSRIETGMQDVHRRLVEAGHLKNLPPEKFAVEAGKIIGDVNYVHPFREGNGRTQLQYLRQLSASAGHRLDLRRIEPADWLEASKTAHMGNYDPMGRLIAKAITPEPTPMKQRGRDDRER